MDDANFVKRLTEIRELAAKQAQGPYTVQSDAAVCLAFFQTLTQLLIDDRKAHSEIARKRRAGEISE